LAATFSVLGVLSYLLGLGAVARAIPHSLRSNRVVDFYAHNPYWMIFELLLALAVLGAIGVEAWRDADSVRTRAKMVIPGLLVWAVLPAVFGTGASHLLVPAAGALASGALLFLGVRRAVFYAALPAAVTIELTVNGLLGGPSPVSLRPPPSLGALPNPTVKLAKYLHPGPIYEGLLRSDGRYATVGSGKVFDRTTNRGTLFGAESVDAYNAVQLRRYWSYVRAVQAPSIKYNRAYFLRSSPAAFNLLQINSTVTRRNIPPASTVGEAQHGEGVIEGDWALHDRRPVVPRAQIVARWRVADSSDSALRELMRRQFDPSRTVVLEEEPGLRGSDRATAGTARYRWTGDQSATILVNTTAPGLLLIRNAYDEHWHATVDGRSVPVLAADYVIQAVPVTNAGPHTVELSYDDPTLGYGLLVSAVSIGGFLVYAAWSGLRERADG
jgi:hypothetical protein